MTKLHAALADKLVQIEKLLTVAGNDMSEITLFARNPKNDNQTVILSSEGSEENIRRAFEIVMASSYRKSELSESDALKAIVDAGVA